MRVYVRTEYIERGVTHPVGEPLDLLTDTVERQTRLDRMLAFGYVQLEGPDVELSEG